MAWINIVVAMVIPDVTASGVGFAEITAALGMACILKSVEYISSGNEISGILKPNTRITITICYVALCYVRLG
jgi:hypothetical protein